MWAAIRYRRAQALVLVLLAALIATCASFAPLYQRALEQAQLRQAIGAASPADTALVVRAGRTPANPGFDADTLRANVPAAVARLYGAGVGQLSEQISVVPRDGLKPSPLTVLSRTDVCQHVELTVGTCPSAPGQVMVSAKDLAAWKWKVGTTFPVAVPGSGASGDLKTTKLTVSGAYEVQPDPVYWMREQLDGKSGTLITIGLEQVPAIDDFVVSDSTFTPTWGTVQGSYTMPLDRTLFTLGNLDEISQILGQRQGSVAGGIPGALVETKLPTIIDGLRVGQQRLQVIVPLLMAQLGLLAVAILLLVAQATVEQRRPEVALARLRGRSREGAGRLIMGELALTVGLGLPIGFLLALLLTSLVRWFLLPSGVPFEVPWTVLAALGVAAVACAVAIWVAARPVQRLTVSSLLRRVAPERQRAVGVFDILAVALAVFGVVGLATKSLEGPLALITPTLIALAAGLVVARVTVPVAAAAGRTNLRRGQVGRSLTAFGLQRRSGPRKVITVVSVAVALTVFAANALVVGDRNWSARAEVQNGAPLVLDTDSRNPTTLLAATRTIDPDGTRVSPVAVVRRVDAKSTPTMAVVTRTLDEIGFAPPGTAYRLGSLAPPDIAPVQLKGTRVTGTVRYDLTTPESEVVQRPPGQSGAPTAPTTVVPQGDPNELRLSVTMPTGQRLTRLIGTIPLDGKGTVKLNGLLLCPDTCRLDGFEFRKTDPVASQVSGTLSITGLGIDGKSLEVGKKALWNPYVPATDGAPDSFELKDGPADTLAFELLSTGFSLSVTHADVPAILPGLLAGDVPPGGTPGKFDAVGLAGVPIVASATQRVATLPVLGEQGVLVDYETLARLGGTLADTGTLSVWLANPADRAKVVQQLTAQGVGILTEHPYAAAKDKLDESASAQGLRLAAFTGAMGILLAALVVIVMTVTGWRTVARDMAALNMAGVPMATLRRALVREQVVLVLVGSVVGLVCGAVSSLLAMPLVPLFDSTADPVPALDLTPAVAATAGVAVVAALVLVLVGWLSARGSGRRITLQRVRESL
ncbi:FtsX-like permease family protein [Pedococcus dokdonensis]|uniref:FtsX-like permease family protein n=1 Tax=Pedococcus dokdonensis TaxID=443156 RepID=A0A1H0R441_9MICO|nr:FtsX-like permease family protein [Pedococcus dokdonensis]SDP23728.1 FtsX-like permease family protein [Pedococcus dokdonensis]